MEKCTYTTIHFFSETSFDLGKTLSFSIENGSYGRFMRLRRETRWICFSFQAWKGIRRNIDAINTGLLHRKPTLVKLSEEKEINVIEYADKHFVSFSQKSNKNGKTYLTFINLNTSEWSAFLFALPAIDKVQEGYNAPDTTVEANRKERKEKSNCSLCKGMMSAVTTFNDQMKKATKLKMKDYIDVQKTNETAYNQMAYLCTYCGSPIYEDCHCHRFDCKDCEPNNFCDKCDEIIVYKSKFSDS